MPDDLKIDVPAGHREKPVAPSHGLREIGPESEVRGGQEAPEDAPPGEAGSRTASTSPSTATCLAASPRSRSGSSASARRALRRATPQPHRSRRKVMQNAPPPLRMNGARSTSLSR